MGGKTGTGSGNKPGIELKLPSWAALRNVSTTACEMLDLDKSTLFSHG